MCEKKGGGNFVILGYKIMSTLNFLSYSKHTILYKFHTVSTVVSASQKVLDVQKVHKHPISRTG